MAPPDAPLQGSPLSRLSAPQAHPVVVTDSVSPNSQGLCFPASEGCSPPPPAVHLSFLVCLGRPVRAAQRPQKHRHEQVCPVFVRPGEGGACGTGHTLAAPSQSPSWGGRHGSLEVAPPESVTEVSHSGPRARVSAQHLTSLCSTRGHIWPGHSEPLIGRSALQLWVRLPSMDPTPEPQRKLHAACEWTEGWGWWVV